MRSTISPSSALVVCNPMSVPCENWSITTAMRIASHTAAPSSQFDENARCISRALAITRAAALALGLCFTPCDAVDTITNAVTSLFPANIGNLSFVSPAQGQPGAVMKSQSDALDTYNNAVNDFRSI